MVQGEVQEDLALEDLDSVVQALEDRVGVVAGVRAGVPDGVLVGDPAGGVLDGVQAGGAQAGVQDIGDLPLPDCFGSVVAILMLIHLVNLKLSL